MNGSPWSVLAVTATSVQHCRPVRSQVCPGSTEQVKVHTLGVVGDGEHFEGDGENKRFSSLLRTDIENVSTARVLRCAARDTKVRVEAAGRDQKSVSSAAHRLRLQC